MRMMGAPEDLVMGSPAQQGPTWEAVDESVFCRKRCYLSLPNVRKINLCPVVTYDSQNRAKACLKRNLL